MPSLVPSFAEQKNSYRGKSGDESKRGLHDCIIYMAFYVSGHKATSHNVNSQKAIIGHKLEETKPAKLYG